jgi:hypothetical protein
MSKTTIYICSDATLTYGPYGGRDKIVPQALPVGVVDSPDKAETLIQLVGSKAWNVPENDPDFTQQLKGRTIQPGYGPQHRYRYSLPDFEQGNEMTIFEVSKTFDLLIEGKTREGFERAQANPA